MCAARAQPDRVIRPASIVSAPTVHAPHAGQEKAGPEAGLRGDRHAADRQIPARRQAKFFSAKSQFTSEVMNVSMNFGRALR